MLRRAELNGRVGIDGECPWSIRQTAVYHKVEYKPASGGNSDCPMTEPVSTFLLVAPSQNAESQFSRSLDKTSAGQTNPLSCWDVHRILVADSLSGWADYMAFLHEKLKEQSDEIVLATVGENKANLSPLTDFNINFEHRQQLKIVEDMVLDLELILPGLLDAIGGVKEACSQYAKDQKSTQREILELDDIIDEFDEYEKEARLLIERAKTLKSKADSTAHLVR